MSLYLFSPQTLEFIQSLFNPSSITMETPVVTCSGENDMIDAAPPDATSRPIDALADQLLQYGQWLLSRIALRMPLSEDCASNRVVE